VSAAALSLRFPRPRPERYQPTRAELVDELTYAHAHAAGSVYALGLTMAVIRDLATRAAPHNASAEARVLGALLLGRATLADVADLVPEDFYAPGHRELFAVIVAALECGPALPAGQPTRALLTRRVRRVMRRLPGGTVAPGEPDPPWVAALDALPWPATCPRAEIVRVRELGRQRRGE
jgi:hypothetical protein